MLPCNTTSMRSPVSRRPLFSPSGTYRAGRPGKPVGSLAAPEEVRATRSRPDEIDALLELLPALRRVLRLRTPTAYQHEALSSAQLQVLMELASGGTQPMS